ncbi:dNTP triphosphohydrolase [Microbacterium sp. ISL-103]|uniref:dGTP triphosphohydrolase n=1 Tax=Microbacterium sp. ISL-103 TaxID=2819156 RepID=UPI001BE646C4|nr:dNTP triphosphohydrolase [Microbacterium sp. ISL-103]MBT2474871.1 dNTP triphosphohydrolase [Microbacterium sp. ISL-103]
MGGAAEPANEPWRQPGQIDSDRVFYAPEFRRLSGVTQVVPPQDGYLFHDRLSHSLKVAQVAATLARRLAKTVKPGVVPAGTEVSDWVHPDHCYVAGLAHDIGHPPFGHAGEHTLQTLMKEPAPVGASERLVAAHRVLAERSFEGNAQSTRIVAALSFRKEREQPGLQLTLRSMAAIAKYPWLRGGHPYRIEKLAKKWSFYEEEADLLTALVDNGFIHIEREPESDKVLRVHRWPEAEIMDWADDITYAVHDLEDFFRAGRTPLHRIHTALKSAPDKVNWATTDFDFATDDEARGCLQFIFEKLKKVLDDEGTSLAEHIPDMWATIKRSLLMHFPPAPFSGSRTSHAALQKFASTLIVYLSENTSLQRVDGLERVRMHVDPVARLVSEFFKALNSYYVIETASLAVMQYGQAQDLRRLFDSLVAMCGRWLQDVAGDPYPSAHRQLPARLREYLVGALEITEANISADGSGSVSDPGEDPVARDEVAIAVVDYICSLRDAQAAILTSQLHQSPDPAQMHATWLNG